MRRKKLLIGGLIALILTFAVLFSSYFIVRAGYLRVCRETVENSGAEAHLVYAVMKAESGFQRDAVSRSGAVGLMQLRPSTAKFVCERYGIGFDETKLTEADYNAKLGCMYLNYLLGRFEVTETALAAYNAGEGVVRDWLTDPTCSADGQTLSRIPYPETRAYVKKVMKFKKFYDFFYG